MPLLTEEFARPNWQRCRIVTVIILLIMSISLFMIRLYSANMFFGSYIVWRRYDCEKRHILQHEESEQFGGGMDLTSLEQKANKRLIQLKLLEYGKWDFNESSPLVFTDFNEIRDNLEDSIIYQLIQKMPKGAILHINDIGMVNIDYLIYLTYYEKLWVYISSENVFEKFQFSDNELNETMIDEDDGAWYLLKDYRDYYGAENVDAILRDDLTLKTNGMTYMDIIKAQQRIKNLLKGLISYIPVWKAFCKEALENCVRDGVQYVEIRSDVYTLYDINGYESPLIDSILILKNISDELSLREKSFIGSKIIYTPSRNVPRDEMDSLLYNALIFEFVFGDYFAGIDLIGDRYISQPLREFVKPLLDKANRLDYYITNADGQFHDPNFRENLIDAYLLGSKRLVFTYPVLQHPFIIRKYQKSNAGIVINPISHQMLKTPGYSHYHPAGIFFGFNLNLIVSSDYPALWGAQPLSHDLYLAFMAVAPQNADLKVLKQLALNSITYSAMAEPQKEKALNVWKILWNDWINYITNDTLY